MKKVAHLLLILLLFSLYACGEKEIYVCTPCDQSCDKLAFTQPGKCPHCGMDLMLVEPLPISPEESPEEKWVLNEVILKEGSGAFLLAGGKAKAESAIKVF